MTSFRARKCNNLFVSVARIIFSIKKRFLIQNRLFARRYFPLLIKLFTGLYD